MKKKLIIGFLLILSLSIMAMTQQKMGKYKDDWKKIEALEQEGLPESAGKEVETFLQKAIKAKDNEQVIKALIYRNKYKLYIDDQSQQGLIDDLKELVAQTKNVSEKSLLNSMLAELYLGYYTEKQWQLRSLTPLQGEVPEDMKTWTANIFFDRIIEHLDLSVSSASELEKENTDRFSEIITKGENYQKYYPTLYDFLMLRATNISQQLSLQENRSSDLETSTGLNLQELAQPAKEFVGLNIKNGRDAKNIPFIYLQQYMKYLLQRNHSTALMLCEVEKFNLLEQSVNSFDGKATIGKLLDTYRNIPASAELVPTYVQHTFYDSYRNNNIDNNAMGSAYQFLQEYVSQYPDYERISILKNMIAQMETPSISFLLSDLHYPGRSVEATVIHKNIQSVDASSAFSLYKIVREKTDTGEEEEQVQHIKDFSLSIVSQKSYLKDTTKFDLGELEVGSYRLAYIDNVKTFDSMENKLKKAMDNNNTKNFVVSRLTSYNRNSGRNQYEIFVVDRISGKPLSDVTVNILQQDWDENSNRKPITTTTKTNELGLALFTDKNSSEKNRYVYERAKYSLALGTDTSLPAMALTDGSHNYTQMQEAEARSADKSENITLSLFTDRSVYRPGQTLFFKAIAADKDNKVVTNKKYTATLYNSRNEKVSELNVATNEFGSLAGNFVLPQGGMLGHYRVQINNISTYVQVAEYKRPTFEITFDKVEGSYSFGEEITVTGRVKTFSGVNLQDAEVLYSITRRDTFPFYSRASGGVTPFGNGTIKTDAEGKFTITFVPKAADSNSRFLRTANKNIFAFDINATVTDSNGESQSNNYSVNVGNVSMAVNITMPQQIEKSDSSKIEIRANNLQGLAIETKGSYKLYKLDDKDSIQNTVLTGNFSTGLQTELKKQLMTIESGKYQLEVKALDDKAREVDAQTNFVLFSYSDKKPPIKTNAWVIEKNTKFGNNKPAEIIFGTSNKDSHVLYTVYNNDKVFERRFITLSDVNQHFKLDYKPEYGKEVYVSFTSVKDGEFTNKDILLSQEKEVVDTGLNIVLQTFRDKLRTGQNETWTISVKDKEGKAVSAELLASMYDISLDQINAYMQWYVNRAHKYEKGIFPVDFNYADRYKNNYPQTIHLYINEVGNESVLTADALNWFDYPLSSHGYFRPQLAGRAYGMLEESSVMATTEVRKAAKPASGGLMKQKADMGISDDNDEADKMMEELPASPPPTATAPQIRQNFNETAFFFPQLRTNEKGETLVSFTVPESNTTWRFRVLAHDKNLKVGQDEKMVVTSKELMVTPNMPRFIRQGDRTSISTKISNLSEGKISGDVWIEFFDPVTEKTVDGITVKEIKQSFAIEPGASVSASWAFDVPSDIDLLGCRIVAQNANFSDGEQHALPVLPNRMLVTESMPFDVTKAGENVFTFDKLGNNKSKTLTNYKLTLEYANNPAWYAVLALPTMSNPTNENAVSWFASYYTNTLGSSIAQQRPKVANMIKAWKQQGGNKDTFVSKLNKNEELKNILLEETPWVLDAKTEEEQMERLSLLFDLNNSQTMTLTATDKLKELQTPEGGWAWYKGMNSNRSVTQYIMYGLAELVTTASVEYPQSVKEMQMRALKYMDQQIVKDFELLKSTNKTWKEITAIQTSQLEYMYVRSFYRDVNPSHETREAERFYQSVVSKNWTKLGLYEKSLLSILLQRNAEKELAAKVSQSIREYAKVDETQGMYWPNNRGYAFLSMSAVSQHTFLMQALKENGADNNEMDLMKKWLVKQKQTQIWESTHATIDAINTLLSTGNDWFAENTEMATIKVGAKTVDTQNKELGTGYIKTSWNDKEIDKSMAKVSVTKPNTAMSYGAMYWQYYEDLDKITAQDGELSVQKELYKKVKGDKGESLVAITASNPIAIGDQVVVRLTIRAANDMQFVHLKDMRASCFEPLNSLSGTQWKNGLMYYQTVKDASTNYFFDNLKKGTYVLEYPLYATRSGEYSNGITTLQCLYSPDFASHTSGIKVSVKEK